MNSRQTSAKYGNAIVWRRLVGLGEYFLELRLQIAAVFLVAATVAQISLVASAARVVAAPSEQFFIISSVDARKKQLLLKLPTEVTEVMLVNSKTSYFGEDGRPMRFQDLRAGDTVYITSTRDSQRDNVAIRIRKGPMTVEELHRRYLPGVASM